LIGDAFEKAEWFLIMLLASRPGDPPVPGGCAGYRANHQVRYEMSE
jgi:hypothetical protein